MAIVVGENSYVTELELTGANASARDNYHRQHETFANQSNGLS